MVQGGLHAHDVYIREENMHIHVYTCIATTFYHLKLTLLVNNHKIPVNVPYNYMNDMLQDMYIMSMHI